VKPSLSTWAGNPIDVADGRAEHSTLPNRSREAETETVIREFRRRRSLTRPRAIERPTQMLEPSTSGEDLREEALSAWASEGGSL
jgi:hypothetical protein